MPVHVHEAVRAYQREMTDYFNFWRAGIEHAHDWNARKRSAVKEFPTKGNWPGLADARRKERRPRRFEHWDEPGPAHTKELAKAIIKQLASSIQWVDIRFVKILGWGGLGVAALFEATSTMGFKRRVVCKMDLYKQYPYIAAEKEMHLRTAGAKHVTQRVVMQEPRKQRNLSPISFSDWSDDWSDESDREDTKDTKDTDMQDTQETQDTQDKKDKEDKKGKKGEAVKKEKEEKPEKVLTMEEKMEDLKIEILEKIDNNPALLFIEYVPRGRFDDYIGKVAQMNGRFPDQVLWTIFQSLFRGVIGLAYPDAFQPLGADPRKHGIESLLETYEGLPTLKPHGERGTIVHFDLDPLNVLVGEFDSHEHNIVPCIKIADLGLARLIDGKFRRSAEAMWPMRKNGKTHILTPEQFTEEWDYVDDTPQAAQTKIAGNFSWWTNIYQVGLIMFSLITLHQVEHPPVIEELPLKHPDGTVTKEWTYGGWLTSVRFRDTDETLRHLVALCLCADPARRPDMQTLEQTFLKYARAEGPVTEEDRDAQKWAVGIFGGPPPPPGMPWYRYKGGIRPGYKGAEPEFQDDDWVDVERVDRPAVPVGEQEKEMGKVLDWFADQGKQDAQALMDKVAPAFAKDWLKTSKTSKK